MSRLTPYKRTRRSVKKLERQLGFDFSSGLASINRTTRDRPGPIGDLWESLKSLNEIRDISPQKLSNEARELFDLLGPSLWPRDTSQAWWLLKHPHIDYPRQLCYDDREDQEQLWGYWLDMIQEKRLNHEDHLSRQGTKSWRQSEDATSVSTEAGFADEVRYEYPPTANMRSGSAFSSAHSPVVQSDVPVENIQIKTRASASYVRPSKRPAGEPLERMSFSGLANRSKRLANESPETTSFQRSLDRDKRPVGRSYTRADGQRIVLFAPGSHARGPNPPPTTSRPQVGTPDAPSITSRPQAGISYSTSTTPGLEAGTPNPLAKVRIFLEVQRSTGPPKKCWSIPVEDMDIFTGERVRTRLRKFRLLKDSEKVALVHISPDDGGRSIQGLSVETTFIMPWDCPEQPDWYGMLDGLKDFYSTHPTALDLKLRATLEVEGEEL